jgi:hypothetical protein
LDYTEEKSYWSNHVMEREGLKLMIFDKGNNGHIRSRFISKWFNIDFHVLTKEGLFSEIGKQIPDAVVVGIGLYDRIGGIDTLNMIRDRLDVNAWFE